MTSGGLTKTEAWNLQLQAEIERLTQALAAAERERDALKDKADAVLFHQLCCLGGCHESLKCLAELAKMVGFEADPATMEELEAARNSPQDWSTENVAETWDCFIESRQARIETAEASLAALRVQVGVLTEALTPRRSINHSVFWECLNCGMTGRARHLIEHKSNCALASVPPDAVKVAAVVSAVANLIDNSPVDDDDRPYISETAGSEFDRLVTAFNSMKGQDDERN